MRILSIRTDDTRAMVVSICTVTIRCREFSVVNHVTVYTFTSDGALPPGMSGTRFQVLGCKCCSSCRRGSRGRNVGERSGSRKE